MLGAIAQAVAATDAALEDDLGEILFHLDRFYRATADAGVAFFAFFRQGNYGFHGALPKNMIRQKTA
jgi:hypothetical protein